jgi:hypothetical protein
MGNYMRTTKYSFLALFLSAVGSFRVDTVYDDVL